MLSQSVLNAGQIQIGTAQGVALQYDANGNRRVATNYQGGVQVAESYNYDANNRLTTTNRGGQITSSRAYNAAGEVTQTISYSSPGSINERRESTYNVNGQLTQQDVFNGAGGLTQRTIYTGYDGAGNSTSYQTSIYTGTNYTNYYGYEYAKYDGYKEKKVNGSSSYFAPGATTVSLDVNGNTVSVSETFATSKNRSFLTTTPGQILQKTENGQTQYYFYANDKPIGSSGALSAADFDYNYTPVSAQYPGATPGSYVVSQGDTLTSISHAVFGDPQLWYIIADANGLNGNGDLKVGQQLTIPNKITNWSCPVSVDGLALGSQGVIHRARAGCLKRFALANTDDPDHNVRRRRVYRYLRHRHRWLGTEEHRLAGIRSLGVNGRNRTSTAAGASAPRRR